MTQKNEPKAVKDDWLKPDRLGTGHTLLLVIAVLLALALACGGSAADPTATAQRPAAPDSTDTPTPQIQAPAGVEAPGDEATPDDSPEDAEPPTGEPPEPGQPPGPEAIYYAPDGNPCRRSDYYQTAASARGQTPLEMESPPDAVLSKLPGQDLAFTFIAYSPDGQSILTLDGRRLSLWPAVPNPSAPHWQFGGDEGAYIGRPAFSPDGALVAVPASDGVIHLLEVSGGAEIGAISAQAGAVAFDPAGEILAVASGPVARLFDLNTGQELARLEGVAVEEVQGFPPGTIYADGHARGIVALAFSPDGQVLMTAGHDGAIRLWDVAGRRPLRCYEDEEGTDTPFRSAALSPDGRLIVGQRDRSLFLWDAQTGQILRRFDAARGDGQTQQFRSVVFSPDGRAILSGSEDRSARVWDVDDGRVLALMRHPDVVNWAAFDPAGQHVAAALGAGGFSLGGPPVYEAWVWDAAHPDVRLAAEAQNLVEEAVAQIAAGDLSGGRTLLQQAGALNPFPVVDLESEGLGRGAWALLAQGVDLALAGDPGGARAAFELAQTLQTVPVRDRVDAGLRWAVGALTTRAQEQARAGQVDEALASAATADELAGPPALTPYALSQLCRYGALWDRASAVIATCEAAVSLASDSYLSADARDGRGIARALLADFGGAIADFNYFIDQKADDPFYAEAVAQRQAWVAELSLGRNPLDAAALEALRQE